jgi:hypothetical protein
MAQQRPPWKLRAADFSSPGWHIRPTVGYELMFEFLRLSPSYELARREAVGELTAVELKGLPPDFDEVRRTFALLGDVQAVLFRTWWLQRGLRVFGSPNARPRVHELSAFPGGRDIDLATVVPSIERYLEDARRDEGLAGSILLAVPTDGRRSEVLAQVARLLDQHVGTAVPVRRPLLALQGQRLRAKVLFNGIRLLWIRAARPKWELWRLGAKARLSPTYSAVLSVDAPRKVASDREMIDREMMSKITYRALIKFEATAENAARGRFPSDQEVEQVRFDYPNLAKTIQRKNAWESREKARLIRAVKARAARRQAERPIAI